MDLEEAVTQAEDSVEEWSVHLLSPLQSDDMNLQMETGHAEVMRALSFGGAPKEMIIKTASAVGVTTAEELKNQIEEADGEIKGVLYEKLKERIAGAAIPMFATGYTLRSPDYSELPRSRETFFTMLKEADAIKALAASLSNQYFMVEKATQKAEGAGHWVDRLFSMQNVPKDKKMIARFCALASAMSFTEMYALGYLSRGLLENSVTQEQAAAEQREIAAEFDQIIKGLQED